MKLAERKDFSIEQAFKMFSDSTLDRLTPLSLAEGLSKMCITVSPETSLLLVSRYDADGDGKLSFWEFSNIFYPLDSSTRAVLEGKGESY